MIPGSANPLLLATAAGEAGGYQIERSLRFNPADSAYLSRTPASAGNRKTWTWTGWVKRSRFNFDHRLFDCSSDASNRSIIKYFGDNLQVYDEQSDTVEIDLQSNAVYRDPSAWHHVVVSVDTTQSTAADRVKIYVNGSEVTSFSTSIYPSLNLDTRLNGAFVHNIGKFSGGNSQYLEGYLADVHFIDGQALDPTDFGEFDATTGVWNPKAYTGTYGTNGFHLDFADNSSAAALGYDAAGSNDWTVNNISVTAGAGNDSLVDSPTNYGTDTGAGGEVRGNYCTLNRLITVSGSLSNGNLEYTSGGQYRSAFSTFAVTTGKWYFEGTVTNLSGDALIGIASGSLPTGSYLGSTSTSWSYAGAFGDKWNNGGSSSFGATFTNGDVIGVAFDADTGKLWFSKNGVWQASGNPASSSNPAFTVPVGASYFFSVSGGNNCAWSCNFGQRPFAYTAPSGFKALCTTNLPAPTIENGSDYFDTVLYTGNGTTQTISGFDFSPDLVWLKSRSAGRSHGLFDSVRGVNTRLMTDSTGTEVTTSNQVTAFTADGFTLGGAVNYNDLNASMVAWAWDAGSSTATNNDGTISSQVRVNVSAGFSVVTYTSPSSGSNQTVGHGLGVKPSLLIVKNRDNTLDWDIYHSSLGFNASLIFTNAGTRSGAFGAEPTSTVFTTVSTYTHNGTDDYVAYCFAPVEGYSAFGSYTGNSSTDGPFVYTGFRPRWVLCKGASTAQSWNLYDTARNEYNVADLRLFPHSSNAETLSTTNSIDILSNGFKLRGDNASTNFNNATYIYAAFAENPFALARAR
jgi:hypothetical protein